ncbi:MAG TPA: hypothetical protein VNJ11_17100, partial [Bryobacteraceae bacterium]|nr:hypothetical protein [Bryobacteraceae bacterium]
MDVVAGPRPDTGLIPARGRTVASKENILSRLRRTENVVAPAEARSNALNCGHREGRLRILLSAFSCAPGVGSEPGLSWGLAHALASGHDVWLLLDEHNQDSVEKISANRNSEQAVKFVFVKLPKIFRVFYSATWRGYPYYFLWQIAAYLKA